LDEAGRQEGAAEDQRQSRPDSVCVRDWLAAWGGRIRTSASYANSPRLSARGFEPLHLEIRSAELHRGSGSSVGRQRLY